MRSSTSLFDQNTFDKQFLKDIKRTQHSLVIESPFIRLHRVNELFPIVKKLKRRGVAIIINTRHPDEHNETYAQQARQALAMLQELGVIILFTVKHHRKLAIIDREIFYEGSLNILSYYDSCEIMRRTVSAYDADNLLTFIGLNKYVKVNHYGR